MAEILISTTVLILIVLVLRRVTLGRISMSMRYALWFIVAARLVMPISIGSSPVSVMNAVGRAYACLVDIAGSGSTEYEDAAVGAAAEPDMFGNMAAAIESDEVYNEAYAISKPNIDVFNSIVITMWVAGMAAIGGYMVVGQVRFLRSLYRSREVVAVDWLTEVWENRLKKHKLRVYMIKGLPSPCMVGRSIYISTELCDDRDKLLHVLAHEYAHAAQRDAVWAIVRSVLCMVYWFHPLVWVAAYEARQDSELAGDERAIRLLGEMQRLAYGKTLLALLSDRNDRIGCTGMVLTMSGSGKKMRERVSMIAGTQKKSVIAACFSGLVMILACGCSFTGAVSVEDEITEERGRTESYVEVETGAGTEKRTEEEERDVSVDETGQIAEMASEQSEEVRLVERLNEIEMLELQVQNVLDAYEAEKSGIQKLLDEIEEERLRLKDEEEAREASKEDAQQLESMAIQEWYHEIEIQELTVQREIEAIEAHEMQIQQELAEIKMQKSQIQQQIDENAGGSVR